MELLDGDPLDRAMAKGRLPMPQAVSIGLQLSEALAYAHELGVVHRDIKPSNIHLSADGRTVKILDFGIARLTEQDLCDDEVLRTQIGQLVGTPRYMSPEQALSREIDGRSDLFSTGVVLYELLTGAKAFDGTTAVALALQITQQDPKPMAELTPDAPRGLQVIVRRLLSKRPERRFQTGAELAAALRREQQVLAAMATEGEARRGLSSPARVTLAMAALTAVALTGGIGTVMNRQDAALRQMSLTSGAAITNFIATNAALGAAENAAAGPGQQDWLPVQSFVKSAAADPHIREIAVIDSEGVVRAASRPEAVGRRYVAPAGERVVASQGRLTATAAAAQRGGDLRFTRPITYAGRDFGRVDVRIAQAAQRSASATSWMLLAMLGLFTLGVVTVGSYILARALVLPARRLRRAIDALGAGDLGTRIAHERQDEFGHLFHSFNRTAAVLQDRLEAAEMEVRIDPAPAPLVLAPAADGAGADRGASDAIDPERTIIAAYL
jgi:HAMP domain-containing protein